MQTILFLAKINSKKELNIMSNQKPWSSPQIMVDWFNQIDDPDAFFKENGYNRFPFIQDSISLKSESVQITLSTTNNLENQQNRINNYLQDELILGYASISVEIYIEDKSVSGAEMTFELKLPMSLKPENFFSYINSKIIDIQNSRKEIFQASKLEK